MVNQKEWIKKNYTDKGVTPWICITCGEHAEFHECPGGKHKFYCWECLGGKNVSKKK